MTAEVRRRLRPPSAGADLPELQPVEANYHVLLTVFKRKGLILICALVFAAAAAVAMLMTPVAPSATAKILIKPGRDALPIAGLLTSPVRTGHTPDLLHTEAELFTSRVVLLPVARALRAERREPDVDADLDAEVSALRSQLVVAPIPNTSILQATASADEPEEAERVLRLVVDSYVEQHAIGYSGSTSLVSFLERETERAATVLTEAEDRLEQWKASHHIVAVDDQIASQLAGVAEFEGALKRAEVDLEATRAQVDTLTREIAALPAQSVTSRENTANPLVARLKSDLAAEEATLRDARRNPVTERLRLDTATA
ncbi:MAG TPA: Wzz/FepE/Etk N-terminal domain-containing protein, partial [Candidatus Binatia bacterium]|nr:Wzz/FepE/Etk N-terminal domain-containing protein [Candidatus Binatia bacterium]